MPTPTAALPCAVCSDPVDPEDAHWLHDDDCPGPHTTTDDLCACDKVAHPDCCPLCRHDPDLDHDDGAPTRTERTVTHRGHTYAVERVQNVEGRWRITLWTLRGHLVARRRDLHETRLDEVEQQLLDAAVRNEPPHRAHPLAFATWLLALIRRRMDQRPDGSAHVHLQAEMVRMIKDFVTDQAHQP